MPAAKPPEFRRRAVELARSGEYPVAKVAGDLGIAQSCLRRWMKADDVDAGRVQGLTRDERAEVVRLRRDTRVQAMEIEILKAGLGVLRPGKRPPKMIARLVCELAEDGFPVAVSSPGAQAAARDLLRTLDPATVTSRPVGRGLDGQDRRGPRAVPRHLRVPAGHADLRLDLGIRCGRKRVARLMTAAGLGRGLPPAQTRGTPAAARSARGPGPPPVHRRRAGPAVVHRHHRTPHQRREGLLRRGHRRVVAADRGLVDRGPHPHRARRRRPHDGPVAAPTGWNRGPLRPRQSVHVLDFRAPAARSRAARLHGPGRVLGRQRADRVLEAYSRARGDELPQ